jgi:hypothetical protein
MKSKQGKCICRLTLFHSSRPRRSEIAAVNCVIAHAFHDTHGQLFVYVDVPDAPILRRQVCVQGKHGTSVKCTRFVLVSFEKLFPIRA